MLSRLDVNYCILLTMIDLAMAGETTQCSFAHRKKMIVICECSYAKQKKSGCGRDHRLNVVQESL